MLQHASCSDTIYSYSNELHFRDCILFFTQANLPADSKSSKHKRTPRLIEKTKKIRAVFISRAFHNTRKDCELGLPSYISVLLLEHHYDPATLHIYYQI